MAFKYREEIVGKRFLSVRSATKLKTSKLSEWEWRSGVVRAVTHKDTTNAEFTVLVEFDDCEWKRREWIRVYEIFQVFLVEFTLVWAPRQRVLEGADSPTTVLWPALSFKVIVDKSNFASLKLKATEYVADGELEFLEDSVLRFYKVGKFEDDDTSVQSPARDDPEVRKAVRRWLEQQDGQSILLTTPSVLVGYRVEVYCAEGTRQWYTAVIHSYNENTRELSVTDDTVLEVHNEDPSMVQMKLIGDGVVESILKGENLGITPRRRSCNIRNVNRERDRDNESSTALLARLHNRTRSQSPSQSSPAGGVQKSTPSRTKGRQKALPAPGASPASSTASAASANHGPGGDTPDPPTATTNPPDTAPAKDEKEKPPDRGKTRTSQRERKRRTDEVTTPPPAKQKALEKEKEPSKEKKVCKEITRTTSIKAGSILPASTQPTVLVKPVRTLDSKIIKEVSRETSKSPKTITSPTPRAPRKAKEANKEITKETTPKTPRTGSPASGVRSRTPQRKDKEDKIKEKPSTEKTPTEQKRKTRDSSAKRKEIKQESKRLKEDDRESPVPKEKLSSKPASPASSTSSVCSSATSRFDGRSRTSTPTRNLDSKTTRASPAPTKPGTSDLKKKDSSSRAATPLSDRLGTDGSCLPSAPQSSPAVEPATTSAGSCLSIDSSSKHTATIAATTNITSSSTAAVISSTTSTTASSSITTSTTLSSPCSTGVGTILITNTTTTTTYSTLSCTTSTSSSTSSATSSTPTPLTPSSCSSSNSPNASSRSSTGIITDSQRPATRSPCDLQSPVAGLRAGRPPRVEQVSAKDTSQQGSNSSSGPAEPSDSVTSATITSVLCQSAASSSSTVSTPNSTTINSTASSTRITSPPSAPTLSKPNKIEGQSSLQSTTSAFSPCSPRLVSSMSNNSSKPATSSSKLLPSSGRCDPASSSASSTSTSLSLSSTSSLLASAKSSRPDEDHTMHFKKMILLDGYHKKEASSSSSSQETFTAASGINVNHSLTDQITKLSSVKADRYKAWNNNDLTESIAPPNAGGAGRGSGDFPNDSSRHQTGPSPASRSTTKKMEPQLPSSMEKEMGRMSGSYALPSRTDKPGKPEESGRSSADSSRSDFERRESELRERLGHPTEERSHSRSSADDRRPSSSSSASNSRMEEHWRTAGSAGSEAHGASPLIFDKNEPVRVYRDPELLKRDEMRYFQQRQQGEPGRHTSAAGPGAVPPVSPAFQSVAGHPSPLSSPHHAATALTQAAAQRPMLNPHSLSYNPHLPALSPHLQMPSHHAMDQATLRLMGGLPQAMSPYALLPQYAHALHSTAQLEVLWQQKYPTLPVPPAWMLVQYQEELLRDVNLIALERERRERELALERDRVEHAERERAAERDRAERERRERERERERELLERERKHREEQERERKREEAERLERERIEKERKEQERLKREQRERSERGHILKDSAQAKAAVDQHFTASLRLASQKHAAGAGPWATGAPSITHGLPKHPAMAVPPEVLSLSSHHPSAFTHRGIPQPHQVASRDHHPIKKDDKMSDSRPEQVSPHEALRSQHEVLRSQQEALRHSEEKRHQTLQQEHILRHQIMMEKGASAADHHPASHPAAKYPLPSTHAPQHPDIAKQYYMYPAKTAPTSAAPGGQAASMSTTSSSSSSSSPGMASSGHAVKQEPNFSLYGYQPFQHSYISKETLYSQGLKDDKGHPHPGAHLKEEAKVPLSAMLHAQRTASPHGHASNSSGGGKHSRVSPPPLIKDSKTGSVIVENKSKESDPLRQQHHPERHRSPHNLPPPAHSHHGMSGSITLGTALSPRQQSKGIDGRPTGMVYGGHQPRPGSSPHPGHMPPSHMHALPSGTSHHSMVSSGSREHSRSSPLHTSHQLTSSVVMQPMDLHKHVPVSTVAVSAVTSPTMAARDQRELARPAPHHHPHQQHPHQVPAGYSATIAQPPVSLPSTAAHSYNLIQQGLVPNPIYSQPTAGHPGREGVLQNQQQQHQAQHQHSPPSISGQKRRGPKDNEPSSGQSISPTLHHKKSRMAEAMASSTAASPQMAGGVGTVPSGATLNSAAGHHSVSGGASSQHGPTSAHGPSSTTSPMARTAAPSSTSTGFMDSFRSFVENTVQSAFYQDQELGSANKLLQARSRPKGAVAGAMNIMSTQASPMPSTVSVSSPQVTSRLTPPTTNSSPFATATTTTQASPMMCSSATYQQQHQPQQHPQIQQQIQQQRPPSQPAVLPTTIPTGSTLPHSNLPIRPGPASTPGGASVSSTSSIVDTINRVANGYVESDSDTLSAPSPPPQRSDVTPSPSCRPGNHKAFKKAWLQRYSDEDKEKENSKDSITPAPELPQPQQQQQQLLLQQQQQQQQQQEGKPGEPVKDCYVNCSYISPTKEGGSKSPISLLAKDFRKDEEDSTTSASEAESQQGPDGTTKRRMKTGQRRRSSGSSGNKKPKLSEDDKSTTTQQTTATTTTTTGGKKRFSRKGREGVKDSINKGLSDDEAVKERKEVEAKTRQVLHNQHHKQHQSPSPLTVKPESQDKPAENAKSDSSSATTTTTTTKSTANTNNIETTKSSTVTSSTSTSSTTTATTDSTTTNSTTVDNVKAKKATDVSDSDSSTPKENNNKKRGRKNRDKKDKDRDATPPRTENLSAILANKPLNKTNIVKLKKTLEPFMQDSACPEIAPKLMKCRECKMTSNQRNKKIPNIFCRFYAFRRLRYNQKAILAIAGFSEPSDADRDDIELWMPRLPVANPQLDVMKAKYVIQHVGDQFCELVEQEKEAMSWVSPDTKVAWKRAVQGVREMCDVCDTTLFNMHWVCHKCGFVVCIDCYRQRTRKSGGCMDNNCKTCDSVGQKWLTCSINRQPHEPDKLMITQIIPSDALWVVGRMIHEVRDKWKVRSNCPCGRTKDILLPAKNGVSQLLSAAIKDSSEHDDHKPVLNGNSPANGDDHKLYKNQTTNVNGSPPGSLSPLSLLANVASMDSENSRDKKILSRMKEAFELSGGHYNPLEDAKDDDEKSPANCSTLRELLTKTAGRMKPNPENNKKAKTTLDDIIQQVVERNLPKDADVTMTPLLKHYIPKNGSTLLSGRDSPIRCYTLTETSVLYPDVPHSWLDNGRLLRLHDPRHKGNLKLFQQQWRRGQPVLVSNCHKRMTRNLWMPDTFAREFGDVENDLVNCRTGVVLMGHVMAKFWEGFECAKKRLKDDKGRRMILKLKDWPPTEDFSEVLPGRFQDLMNGLPLPEYTHRTGIYNMASRLPDFFVKPDLGPKMYNAYGSALYPREGTTNLHLDISDAVNTMVFVGIPRDDDVDHEAAALKAIDEAGCDILTKQRINESDELPGALWHIFDPLDADKIRDCLNKIAKERGETIEAHHDPIHDQSWYLDGLIRKRLQEEYNVTGYTILQCLGDAVFIPAGAPHQVRNMHSCIKAAEDFVSPENVSYCFKMTQEFRNLTDTHSNHEDKLQVKNIIYHTVKDAVAVLREANP